MEAVIRSIVSILLLLICSIKAVKADDEGVIIAAGRIPYVFAPDLPGPYNRILDIMAKESPQPVSLEYFPIMQAMRQLALDRYDCFALGLKYSPNWSKIGLNQNDFTFIGPIALLKINVYIRPGEPAPTLDQLEDMPIAVGGGIINLRESFDYSWTPTQLLSKPSYIEALEALVAGEVDAMLAYDADIKGLGSEHPLSDKFVNSGHAVAKLEDGIICKSTMKLLPVISGLQSGLDQITLDGTLERLLAGEE